MWLLSVLPIVALACALTPQGITIPVTFAWDLEPSHADATFEVETTQGSTSMVLPCGNVTTTATDRRCTVPSLALGVYSFRLRGSNSSGAGVWSQPFTATVEEDGSAPGSLTIRAHWEVEDSGSVTAFSDDFNRANSDSLGANWTEFNGDIDIASNAASLRTNSYGRQEAWYSGQELEANQYVKVTMALTGGAGTYPEILLRFTNTSSPYYRLQFQTNEDVVEWGTYPDSATGGTTITSTSLTVTNGDTFGVTVTGTGTSTVVRIWRNPTGLPTAADNWDGDTTPDVTFTTDPASPVNTGGFVGMGGYQSNPGLIVFDNFFGGDFAGAGAAGHPIMARWRGVPFLRVPGS